MLECKPKAIVCDAHPHYNTTLFAEELSSRLGVPLVRVQHHIAHAYSVAAEHGLIDFASIVCDGLGYGLDDGIWGGEVFVNDKRVGHLEEQKQLGGDSAAQKPAKMLFSILNKAGIKYDWSRQFSSSEIAVFKKQLEQNYNCPVTTSCGRVLDAVSVLLGFCDERTYDGRSAMILDANSTEAYDDIAPVIRDGVLMTAPLFVYLVEKLNDSKDKGRLAATAQKYIAQGLYEIASKAAAGLPIVFSGGCAYSRVMTEHLVSKGVLVNEKVPSGDGGVAFGQAAYVLQKSISKSKQ
jgi:hydrogenase maturation protein HypF